MLKIQKKTFPKWVKVFTLIKQPDVMEMQSQIKELEYELVKQREKCSGLKEKEDENLRLKIHGDKLMLQIKKLKDEQLEKSSEFLSSSKSHKEQTIEVSTSQSRGK